MPITYDSLGVRRVINASGRMTALGGVALHPDVVAAMAEAATSNVEIAALKAAAGRKLAEWCGAEAAMVTPGASAGNAIMTAAVVSAGDPYLASKLPAADWPRREILLQTGHAVNYGGSVVQDIRLGGGLPILLGAANMVRESDLTGALSERTAGVLYVQSHHAVQKGMLPLTRAVELAHAAGVPVLLDAAAEEDPRRYVGLGVDLVTYSGGKAFEGPTSGFILGREPLVAACRLQESGMARGMKVGKETIAGLLAAMERYLARDDASERVRQRTIIDTLRAGLGELPATRQSVVQDEAGRAIWRLHLTLDAGALGFSAADLMRDLQAHDPPIYPRGHWAGAGTVALDPRPLADRDVPVIIDAVRAVYARRAAGKDG